MESISRPRQLFLYIAPFPALAFFKVWASFEPSPESLTLVTLALFMYCLSILAIARRWDKPTYFDWVIAAYFAAVSLSLLIRPAVAGPVLARYAVTGIYACLLTAAFFPPLLGRDPFTYHYARKTTPEELWENPFFIRINRIMTYAWSGIFAACLLFSLYPSVITRAVIPLGLILGFGLPFNLRFPDYYLKKMGLPSLAEQKRLAAEASATAPQDPVSMPLPESAWEAVSRMPDLFNPEAAGTLDAVIGFRASGAENFEAYLFIQKGACRLETRPPRQPDLLIRTPADVWLAVSRREMDGQQAFFQKAYQADGDLGLLIRLNTSSSAVGSLCPARKTKPLKPVLSEPPLPPLSSVDQPIKRKNKKGADHESIGIKRQSSRRRAEQDGISVKSSGPGHAGGRGGSGSRAAAEEKNQKLRRLLHLLDQDPRRLHPPGRHDQRAVPQVAGGRPGGLCLPPVSLYRQCRHENVH